MDHPADVAVRPADAPRRRPVAALAAVAVFATAAALALAVTLEVQDRRRDGLCRADHGIAGATRSEERTWWPIGERCDLRLPGGETRTYRPGFALTGLLAVLAGAGLAGAVAPAASARRRLAWCLAVPALPVAILIEVVVGPRSLSRLVSLTAISLGFGAVFAGPTALAVWYVARGRVLATALGSWLAWAVATFLQGRDSIGG